MFKPDDFLNNFTKHKDFAKISKFHVEITQPSAWVSSRNSNIDFKDIRFQCEAAELPGYNINTVDSKIYGVPTPIAAFSSFNDITLTFICAGDLWEKKMFDYWMNLIVPMNVYNVRYKVDYVSKITISQFYETGELSYRVNLINAFPINLSPLTLNWGDDGIHKLSVTFKYDYWATENTTEFERLDRQPASTNAGGTNFKPGNGSATSGILPIPGSISQGTTTTSSRQYTLIGGQPFMPGQPLSSTQRSAVQTGLSMGNRYSDTVMQAYRASGGK